MKETVSHTEDKAVFVFIHGFNVTFEDAIKRTAQMAYDLKFIGAPITYSWPSKGKPVAYPHDETNIEWTIPHLRAFLFDIKTKTGVNKIHLIAHSMGNRALTKVLSDFTEPLFNEIILTAPDIDADVFCRDIFPNMQKAASHITLYSSSNDKALILSKKIHGYPRAGDSGEGIVVLQGIDTIDVSALDTNLLGHSYYGVNNSVISDMYYLIQGILPVKRHKLIEKVKNNLRYWVFNP